MNRTINIGGTLLSLDRCAVMSIINITDDSFYSSSRATSESEIAKAIEQAASEGADILDFGGYSSRPGAKDIPLEQELERLSGALALAREIAPDMAISVDTFRSEVVSRLYDSYGAFMVNDITAGFGDSAMIETVGRLHLPYVAMHMRGTPQTMAHLTGYDDIIGDLLLYFRERIEKMLDAGIVDIIIDPGFGFAKSVEENMELMQRLGELKVLGCDMLVGVSRKSMIYKTLDTTPDDALIGTALMNWEALRGGASILRVHDTHQCKQTVTLFESYYGRSSKS